MRWWIKADGCDIVPGLHESVKMEWSGDVDLNDKVVQERYRKYRSRLEMILELGRSSLQNARTTLQALASSLLEDLNFLQISEISYPKNKMRLSCGMFTALEKKQNQLDKGKKNEQSASKSVTDLVWDIQELEFLLKECHWAVAKAIELDSLYSSRSEQRQTTMVSEFIKRVTSIVRGVTRKQREPASHVMVFMISPQSRVRKPYALPVQMLPYRGLKDSTMRDLTNQLKEEMHKRNMEVVGMISFDRILPGDLIDATPVPA